MSKMEEIKLVYFNNLKEELANANKKIEELNDLEARLIEADKELEKANKKIKELEHKSGRDELTGLYNRNYYETNIGKIVQDALTKKQNVGLYIFDLNGLKYVNDNFGHPKGDKILKDFSSLLSSSVRAYDDVIRLGGDEFVVITRKATSLTEQKIKDRLKNKLKLYNEHSNKDINYQLSCSEGYTELDLSKRNAFESAFEIADEKMYKQKKIFYLRKEI